MEIFLKNRIPTNTLFTARAHYNDPGRFDACRCCPLKLALLSRNDVKKANCESPSCK